MAERRARISINGWLGYLAAIVLGMFCLWIVCGSPAHVLAGGLMIDTDYPNAAAAFEIFVRDQWHWPLGESPDFGGVNIFFSDGAPWLALLAKAINGLTGFYIPFHALVIVNIVLFAVMAYRLARCLVAEETIRWLVCALLVFSLIMPVRMIGAQHIALSSYWVVLWAMCCVPVGAEGRLWWRRWEFLAATGLAILSHAYLGAMSIAIVGIVLLSERRWVAAALAALWPLLLLYVVGCSTANTPRPKGRRRTRWTCWHLRNLWDGPSRRISTPSMSRRKVTPFSIWAPGRGYCCWQAWPWGRQR